METQWKHWQSLFSSPSKSLQMVTAAMKLKDTCSWEEKQWQTYTAFYKNRDITLLTEVHIVKVMFFPLVMYWCERWIMKRLSAEESMPLNSVLEKTLQSPLDCKEIKPVNPKGNWPWIIIKRTYTEAPILWPPDEESQLIGKDPDAVKDWRQKKKGAAEDELVR